MYDEMEDYDYGIFDENEFDFEIMRKENYFEVIMDYNEYVITEFKKIPYSERTYDPITKIWRFYNKHYNTINEILITGKKDFPPRYQ